MDLKYIKLSYVPVGKWVLWDDIDGVFSAICTIEGQYPSYDAALRAILDSHNGVIDVLNSEYGDAWDVEYVRQ